MSWDLHRAHWSRAWHGTSSHKRTLFLVACVVYLNADRCAYTTCSKLQPSSAREETPDGVELVSLSLLPPRAGAGVRPLDLSQLRFLLRRLTTHDGATHTIARELTCHELSFPHQNPLLSHFPPVVLEAMLHSPHSPARDIVRAPVHGLLESPCTAIGAGRAGWDPEATMAAVRYRSVLAAVRPGTVAMAVRVLDGAAMYTSLQVALGPKDPSGTCRGEGAR